MDSWGMEAFLKKMFRACGAEIRRYTLKNSPDLQLMRLLQAQRINLILDVGANRGQYARSLRFSGYAGRIVSFEPLPVAYAALLRAARGDRAWEVAPRAAIGAREGEIEIHVAANSVSSSARPMLDAHLSAAPESRYVGTEWAPLARLDSIAPHYLKEDDRVFLKVDTQGYERDVLDGASRILARANALQLELSLVPLYQGQALFDELVQHVMGLGFELHALWPGLIHSDSGRLLQVDAVFCR